MSQGEMFQTYIDRVNGDGGQVKDLSLMYPFVSKLGSLGFSLITVPSAIKAGKLYSIFPSDGSGDFVVNRNGEATYFDKDGLITVAFANEARCQYGLDREFRGLLVENQSTNLFLNSYFSVGLSYWTQQQGQAGYINILPNNMLGLGWLYANNRGPGIYQSIGSVGNVFSFSCLVKRTSGPLGSGINVRFGGTSTVNVPIPNDGEFHLVKDFAIQKGSGNNNMIIEPDFIGVELVIQWVYAELGSNVSSYIPTVESQVTRPADHVSLSDLQGKGFLSPTEGSIFLHIDGDKIADIYQGGNKTTYKNGVLQGTVPASVPTSYLLEPGIYKAVGMKNQALTAGQAIELTSNGLLP